MFVGHDHINNFGGFYKSLELNYGVKTGYGAFNPLEGKRGGRVIKLKESLQNNQTEINYFHYLIFEDGTTENNGVLEMKGTGNTQCYFEDEIEISNFKPGIFQVLTFLLGFSICVCWGLIKIKRKIHSYIQIQEVVETQ